MTDNCQKKRFSIQIWTFDFPKRSQTVDIKSYTPPQSTTDCGGLPVHRKGPRKPHKIPNIHPDSHMQDSWLLQVLGGFRCPRRDQTPATVEARNEGNTNRIRVVRRNTSCVPGDEGRWRRIHHRSFLTIIVSAPLLGKPRDGGGSIPAGP